MMAALAAKTEAPDEEVLLFEKNDKLGKKIFITGKGRGNATNAAPMEEFMQHYVNNPKFLYTAFHTMTNRDVMRLLEDNGCRLKTERGNRVFPASDHAYSITDALKHALKHAGVEIRYKTEVRDIFLKEESGIAGVLTDRGKETADAVIIATGGLTYPSTGSTGDGYRFAGKAGVKVTECFPALVYLSVYEEDYRRLRGLMLKNIRARITDEEQKTYFSDFGDIEFMEEGLRGPLMLSASSIVTKYLNTKNMKKPILTVHIDLKPSLDDKTLDDRLIRELSDNHQKELRNAFFSLLPAQLIPAFLDRLAARNVDINQKAGDVRKEARKEIFMLLRDYSFTISGTGTFKEAIITQGGISVKDISPKTMEAKGVKGLYFAGEVIDVDGFTGGFNMQMAFSTGCLAGKSAASQNK